MNTELRKQAKHDFEFMNNAVFGKTMENVRKHSREVKTDKRRNQLVSEPNCHTRKWFSENLLAKDKKDKSRNE